jgi:3D (Asp-Asp-Asp) domain-containing protein
MRLTGYGATALGLFGIAGCASGTAWVNEPETANDDAIAAATVRLPRTEGAASSESDPARFRTRVIGSEEERPPVRRSDSEPLLGKVLGVFRNTYYDFPSETDFTGDPVTLRDAKCGAIADVPRAFNEAICVQGSGILRTGRTVSFAKRECDCAEMCPRTGEKICFEALDPAKFPWGRGALGTPITPLLTVAVDDTIVPMGTAIYIPEFDGLPIDASGAAHHDGCFIAQDRGLRVKGQHVDVFTGASGMTALWNKLVPTNHGVTVVVENPKCARAE